MDGQQPSEMSEMQALDETLYHLNAYEKRSAKSMARYHKAREPTVEAGVGDTRGRKEESRMSYDASRDPRLRK